MTIYVHVERFEHSNVENVKIIRSYETGYVFIHVGDKYVVKMSDCSGLIVKGIGGEVEVPIVADYEIKVKKAKKLIAEEHYIYVEV